MSQFDTQFDTQFDIQFQTQFDTQSRYIPMWPGLAYEKVDYQVRSVSGSL